MKSIIFGILLLIISFYIVAERAQLSITRYRVNKDNGIVAYNSFPNKTKEGTIFFIGGVLSIFSIGFVFYGLASLRLKRTGVEIAPATGDSVPQSVVGPQDLNRHQPKE